MFLMFVNQSDLLFVLLAERYEQRSLVITSNLVFSKWNQIFQDEMTTTAAIDRLTPTVVKDSILAIGVTKVYPHGFDN